MILLFIGIVIGIIVGVCGSVVVAILPWEMAPPDCDIVPDETPLTQSVLEEHRAKHLAAQGREQWNQSSSTS